MPLDKTDDMGDWIKDFQKSDAPQFKGKSQEKRRQMAIAAKLATENNALRESDITIYEKRAFILAAKQAFLDGKKTFMFKEKEYKCTVKEEQNLFGELTDYLIAKKEDVDTATMADVDDGADAPGDIDPEDLESARDHAAQRFKKFNSEEKVMQENRAKNIKAVTRVLQTLRKVNGKTTGHKSAMMDLLTMFDPKIIEKAYKANPRGFTNLMNMMYPRNKDALTISDLTVNGQFMAKSGRLLSVDQTKQLGNPLDKIKESDDEEIPPHTDMQVESNFRGLSNQDANNHMKFHKVGKPVVAYVKNTDDGAMGDILFYTDGNNVIVASGNRQDGSGRDMSTQDKIISFVPLKGNLKSFASSWVKKNGRDYDFKLDKVADKARVFSNSGADNFFAPRGFPTTKVRIKEEVEYHDRESMPSAVDDAANVMSKLDVYANFIKKTY